MDTPHHLALIARWPSPGQGKTRLIPRLGIEGTCSFARAALTDLMQLLATSTFCNRTFFFTPESARPEIEQFLASESLDDSWSIQPQVQTPDLGGRINGALTHARVMSTVSPATTGTVTFIGMDCFDLIGQMIQDSMTRVSSSPGSAHIIPAADGGYVLLTIPTNADGSHIFSQIPWSCPETGRTQIERLEQAGLTCTLGDLLPDVDEPEDLDSLWSGRQEKRLSFPRTFNFLDTVMAK